MNKRKEFVMFNCELFANNIKNIREVHGLSMNDLASLMHFKSKGTIGQLETQKAQPSFDFLLKMNSIFAVSIDWLIGLSNQPYTNGSLLNAENNINKIICDNNKLEHSLKLLPNYYTDLSEREKQYSLSVRANIVFLMHVLYLPFILKITESNTVYETVINHLKLTNNIGIGKYAMNYPTHFDALLFKDTSEPIYKIGI